ncbi:hypothetical protein [Streptomyces sp. NPDC002952]|uniref:hypothetical protein n=1 Tax=Streptomyces sp. NPDC002952 TaxID=3364673 RepID=UPI00368A7DC2
MREKQHPRRSPDPEDLTSPAVRKAAAAVLSRHSWTKDKHYRIRGTAVSRDELILAPIVDGADDMPGSGRSDWHDQQHKMAWFEAARTMTAWMEAAGWAARGSGPRGTWFRAPGTETSLLAAAPAGAAVRLAAIADELGTSSAELAAAVEIVRQEQALTPADHPSGGSDRIAALRLLFEHCGSEAGVRALLTSVTDPGRLA